MRTPSCLLLGVATLALVAPLTAAAEPGTTAEPSSPAASAPRVVDDGAALPPADLDGPRVPARWQHSSDGVRGEVARPQSPGAPTTGRVTTSRSAQVAPGVTVTEWDEATRRGPVRLQLLRADLRTPGLTVDYLDTGAVSRTAPLSTMVARHRAAVAAVNGDFFDIGDTGAPLGVGADRERGLRHAPVDGWNAAFFLTRTGRYDVEELPMTARVKQRPGWRVTHVNSPEVRVGSIGAYTSAWGRMPGYQVTGEQRDGVRMVVVERGRVVSVRKRLTPGRIIKGTVLIGRGEGASMLAKARKGQKVSLQRSLQGRPRMAITGNKILLRDGVVEVVDDREMHPRTAVGLDRETRSLLLLVVDGRSSASRGYTMVELAAKMIALGADDALNLDGGGSSTMLARDPAGAMRVVNTPSDGAQRSVPNGLELLYRAP